MEKHRKKDSARLVWDTKPRRAPNPKDIEFQTAEVVIPNPQNRGQIPLSFRDGLFGEEEIDKQKINRLIALMKLARDNFAVLIDYWAIDWDYDGYTFKSQWQACRGNGKKAKTVPLTATETLEKKKRIIAVRV